MKKYFLTILLFSSLSLNAFANYNPPMYSDTFIPTGNSSYYALNGGSDYSMPPVTKHTSLDIGSGINLNAGLDCGFNPSISVSNTLNNLQNSVMGLQQNVISSATAAAGSLPMYALEQIDPDLYNLLQNGIFGALQKFNISMKSCQQAMSQINKGQSPYGDWFAFSKAGIWQDQAKAAKQGDDIDINAANDQAIQSGADSGMQWIHGGEYSAGTTGNQQPINVISDTNQAGYNVVVDPKRALDSNAPPTNNPDLTKFWKTPKDAANFAKMTLGDEVISAKPNSDAPKTTAGMGLVSIMTNCPTGSSDLTCVKKVKSNLANIVAASGTPTATELAKVSASGYAITPYVISKLRNIQDKELQSYYVDRIAQSIALQNMVDEALALRRTLIAGSQTQVIHNYTPATKAVNQSIDRLDKDINDLLFEHEVRKKIASNVITNLIQNSNDKSRLIGISKEYQQGSIPVTNNGAVYVNKEGN